MQSKIETTNIPSQQIDYVKLLKHLSDAALNLEKAKGKQFILVLGKTDAGKSTLIKYLQGHTFDFVQDEKTEENVLICNTNQNIKFRSPQIGKLFVSCTLLPEVFQINENLFACDTAGFGDSRGGVEAIMSYLGVQMAVKSASRIKAVIAVVQQSHIKSQKGQVFKSIAQTLSSMFRGDSFQSSFFVFFSKGKKSRKGLQNFMKQMQQMIASLGKQQTNLKKIQEYRDIEAVLSILNKTGNVYPFQPNDKNSREILLDIIAKAPPIPTSCLGIAKDLKHGQELDRIFCDIAIEGSNNIKQIKAIRQFLQDILSEANSTSNIIVESENVKRDQETKISEEEKKIQEEQKQILLSQKIKEKETITLAAHEQRLQNFAKDLQKQQQQIKTRQESLKDGRVCIVNSIQLQTKEQNNIRRLEKTINQAKSTINNLRETVQREQQNISSKTNSINQEQKVINTKNLIITNGINSTAEVCTKIQTRDFYYSEWTNKKNQIQNIQAQIEQIEQGCLESARNNTTSVCIYRDTYNQQAIYGIVKKGVVYKKQFSYSGGCQIKNVDKRGCESVSEGEDGSFSNCSQSGRYASVIYTGPSHMYGWAQFLVYAQYRHTEGGKSIIRELENGLNNKKSVLNNYQRERDSSKNSYDNACSAVNTEIQAVKNRLKLQIQACNNRIQQWRRSIQESSQLIKSSQNSIQNAQSTLSKANTSLQSSRQALQTIKSSRGEKLNSVESSEQLVEIYRKNVADLQSQKKETNDLIFNSKLVIKNADAQIQHSQTMINNSKVLINTYGTSIQALDKDITEASQKIKILKGKYKALLKQKEASLLNLRNMQKENKFYALNIMCDIMGSKLETVDEFYKLKNDLPKTLEEIDRTVNKWIQKFNSLEQKQEDTMETNTTIESCSPESSNIDDSL